MRVGVGACAEFLIGSVVERIGSIASDFRLDVQLVLALERHEARARRDASEA